MGNIIIGILARKEDINGNIYEVISKNNFRYLEGKCSYIGIINNNNIDINVLNMCNGIIIPGGNDIYDYHYEIIDYCVSKNIPVLGICMGCQVLGLYSFNGNNSDLIPVNGHHMTNHKIKIDEDSVLYKLLGDEIIVNSRHKYALPKDKLKYKVGSSCSDVIESIEDINKEHFILGIEWHPEDMDNMECIYNYFLKEVIKRKNI